MSSSDDLGAYVRAVAPTRGLTIPDEWQPSVTLHLKRLLDAAALIDESELRSEDLAPRFEP